MNSKYRENRYLLKDLIRQEIDFYQTDQNLGRPAPPLQKPYPSGAEVINLPDGKECLQKLGKIPVGQAIIQRKSIRRYNPDPLSIEELSALLWATQGVREVCNSACALRSVPSAGARHSFETYLAVNRVGELEPGLYRFLPLDNTLVLLGLDENIGEKAAIACLGQGFVAKAAVTFFWTTIPARMEWRYDLAAHKVIAIDAGHLCQNLYLACESIQAGTCAIAAYNQILCDRLLNVDGEEEFTIYAAPVGKKQN